MKKCYAVVFMNYFPLEVDSLWETREGARTRIQELTNPSNWDVCEMEIRPDEEAFSKRIIDFVDKRNPWGEQ